LVQEFFSFIAVFLSAFSAGFICAFFIKIKTLKEELELKVKEFSLVTKTASDANVSLAEKLISIDHRLDNIDSWRSMMVTNTQYSSGWKKQ
jgi:hypothetical protein